MFSYTKLNQNLGQFQTIKKIFSYEQYAIGVYKVPSNLNSETQLR